MTTVATKGARLLTQVSIPILKFYGTAITSKLSRCLRPWTVAAVTRTRERIPSAKREFDDEECS